MTAKDTVRALLDRLPDDCSLDVVLYHLYVVQAVGEGLAHTEAGRRERLVKRLGALPDETLTEVLGGLPGDVRRVNTQG